MLVQSDAHQLDTMERASTLDEPCTTIGDSQMGVSKQPNNATQAISVGNKLRSLLPANLTEIGHSLRHCAVHQSVQRRLELAHQSVLKRWVDYRLSKPYPAMEPNEKVGVYGERVAAIYLQRKGYFILERSFRGKSGEIDIIAVWQRKVVVFVEVKTWNHDPGNAGAPSDAVDDAKQEKITRTALMYMKRHLLLESPGRADVISIVLGETPRVPQIRHFENAFEAVGLYQMYS